jgi:hypothetical protein
MDNGERMPSFAGLTDLAKRESGSSVFGLSILSIWDEFFFLEVTDESGIETSCEAVSSSTGSSNMRLDVRR